MAQQVARIHGKDEVTGSNPVRSLRESQMRFPFLLSKVSKAYMSVRPIRLIILAHQFAFIYN